VRELHQHVGHLVAAFAAADEDDDFRVRPLGELVLDDGLARTERPGHGGGAALGNREERVNHPLAGHERLVRLQLPPVGPRPAHRPTLRHLQRLLAAGRLDDSYGFVDRELPGANADNLARHPRRHHDAVADQYGLLDFADDVAGFDAVAGPAERRETPAPVSVQGRRLDAAADEISGLLLDNVQRPLNPIVD
jgi:hypothetical protein